MTIITNKDRQEHHDLLVRPYSDARCLFDGAGEPHWGGEMRCFAVNVQPGEVVTDGCDRYKNRYSKPMSLWNVIDNGTLVDTFWEDDVSI